MAHLGLGTSEAEDIYLFKTNNLGFTSWVFIYQNSKFCLSKILKASHEIQIQNIETFLASSLEGFCSVYQNL